ncbi:MAG: hypothetical protein ACI39H_00155 [Lachnospiraceae bacterium]
MNNYKDDYTKYKGNNKVYLVSKTKECYIVSRLSGQKPEKGKGRETYGIG